MGKLRSTVTVHRVMEVVEAWRWFGRPASRPTNGNQVFRGVTRAYNPSSLVTGPGDLPSHLMPTRTLASGHGGHLTGSHEAQYQIEPRGWPPTPSSKCPDRFTQLRHDTTVNLFVAFGFHR